MEEEDKSKYWKDLLNPELRWKDIKKDGRKNPRARLKRKLTDEELIEIEKEVKNTKKADYFKKQKVKINQQLGN